MFLLSKKGMKGYTYSKEMLVLHYGLVGGHSFGGRSLIRVRELIQGNAVFDLELQVWKEG